MSWLRFWAPWLLVLLPLWLLVQAAQPPGWALDPVQLTPRPLGPTESWSSDPSNLPLEFPHPHQQLMHPVVPFLYTGSAGELPPGPDLWDKPGQHQSLPEVVPVVDSQGQHPESPEELEPLPLKQEASSQPAEPPETDENPANLQAALSEPSYTPEEAEPPVQEEAPAQPPEPSNAAESSQTQQESPAWPPDPFEEVVAQPPVYDEVPVPAMGQNQPQDSDLPSVTVEPVGLELSMIPEPPPLGLEPSETGFPSLTQNSVMNTTTNNICELCSCTDETLACVGLSPERKLQSVPVPEPNAHNGTFTILNFQGNSISYVDENTWKSYTWVEKLILSDNQFSELHKDSFEGLLSLQYLDLSCNKIQAIERRTFESLPFLQFINLGCNLIAELSFGTFQAWHGMQFLHTINLSHNLLTTVEDSYFFKLTALKYLDMGKTQVTLKTVESIVMMSPKVEKLILPSRMACCLCQFKNNIEVFCNTVKLHCDSECLTSTTYCDDETSIGNPEGSFMKALLSRKKSSSPELTIEPEKVAADKNAISLSAFKSEQGDFSNESVVSALNYILPYFSDGYLEGAELALLQFIKLLLSNLQGEDEPVGHLQNNAENTSLPLGSSISADKNKWGKISVPEDILHATLLHSKHLGPNFQHQISAKKLETAQSQENSPPEIQSVGKRLRSMKVAIKGPKGIRKRQLTQMRKAGINRKQRAQLLAESTAEDKGLTMPSPWALEQPHVEQLPRETAGSSFNPESSSRREQEAAVPSVQYLMGSPSASSTPKSLPEITSKSKDLTGSIFVSEAASAGMRNMKASEPTSHFREKYLFPETWWDVVHKILQAKMSRQFSNKGSHNGPMVVIKPPFAAMSRMNYPSQEALSSSELTSQENPFLEPFSLLDQATENPTVPEEPTPEVTARKGSAADSAVTVDNFMPTPKLSKETQQEHDSVGTDVPSTSPAFPFPGSSSPGDHPEAQLNEQLRSLITNSDVRRLISHVIWTLKTGCSETHLKPACARLISQTGLLMKLLSEQQEAKEPRADWDTDQWRTENYINESPEAQSEQEEQEIHEFTKEVLGHDYHIKVILASSVAGVVMALIAVFCLIEMCSRRRAALDEEGSSRGFFLLLDKPSEEGANQEGFFWRRQSLWLRDKYRSLSASRDKILAQMLREKDGG
ncbi:leucine-rich repeat-containing protein 37A3-like isoform X3 [Manis pentadactyla]|nr:leucine-rich repeat-containing protein 37A3-like isoform X3 [Manis pentadactyla]XP_057357270.1 leucine-rich repeat-containing protein 37A3-like isoform X3 [Manis pentadactyla]XP_057357271.1 leucine-rich repeat-containing protein 37A3-like isoform X3 [Manis pentadactyla]